MAETKILKKLDPEKLYVKLVKDYIDNRGYSVEQAKALAETVVNREKAMRNMI